MFFIFNCSLSHGSRMMGHRLKKPMQFGKRLGNTKFHTDAKKQAACGILHATIDHFVSII